MKRECGAALIEVLIAFTILMISYFAYEALMSNALIGANKITIQNQLQKQAINCFNSYLVTKSLDTSSIAQENIEFQVSGYFLVATNTQYNLTTDIYLPDSV